MPELVEDADRSMAGNNNNKRTPWHDKKDALLRKLQRSVHFVKTITWSNINGQYEMAFPTWFVKKHGDKFQQTIFLQSGILPITKPWRVQLLVCKRSPHASPEVKLRGGWRKFAVLHGLAEGDDLLFSLRAMSEFDVYVFRKPAPPRKRSRDVDDEVEALQLTGECSSGHSDDEFSGVSTTTEKAICGEDDGPIFAFHGRSMAGRRASTCDLHYLVSIEKFCDISIKRLVLTERSSRGRQRYLQEPPYLRCDVPHHRQESPIRERKNDGGARNPKAVMKKAEPKTSTSPPSFRKRLKTCNVRSDRRASRLEVPREFLRSAYAGGLHPPEVKLQGILERSPERIVVCKWWKTMGDPRLYLTNGWREFGDENGLRVGQELVFTLTADSFLVVRAV